MRGRETPPTKNGNRILYSIRGEVNSVIVRTFLEMVPGSGIDRRKRDRKGKELGRKKRTGMPDWTFLLACVY
jgi:hypothetical protein